MANYTDKPKKHASRDIAVDKLDFYTEPHKSPKKQDKIKGRPKSGWARFCYTAFPQADDSGGEKVRKIVLIVAVVVFVVTIGVLISQLAGMGADKSTNSKIADIAGVPEDSLVNVNPDYDPFNTNATAGQDQTEEIDVTPLVNTPINPNWDELLATNSDVKGWIKITGTAVNNVVVKSYDNSYYLTHNLYREDSVSGTIFSSYLNKWDGTDDNIILYGHNMISGEFFAHVTHYVPNMASKEPLAFYKVHPTVMLATPSGGCETYKIFAGILANTQSQYGEVFDYVDKTKFYSKEDFNNFIIDVAPRQERGYPLGTVREKGSPRRERIRRRYRCRAEPQPQAVRLLLQQNGRLLGRKHMG